MKSFTPLRVSIVVPFYNEADGIAWFFEQLVAALGQIPGIGFDVICVDDGSTDDTLAGLIALTQRDARFRVIELSRNFGKEAALSAGIDAATGDAVIPIDADLQDPPELIAALIAEWRNGADVVLARRSERSSDSFMKRVTAQLFYRIHDKLSDIRIPDNVGDFRLMNRAAVDALKQLPERNRFMKGLFAWVGFKTATVEYARSPRISGETKFSGWKLWNFALEGFTSFSTAPLRLWTYLGGIGASVAVIYAAVIIVRTLIRGVDVPGYASLLVVVLFIGSIQLIGIGVLGEYIGRIYLETKQRPRYLVRATHGGIATDAAENHAGNRATDQVEGEDATPSTVPRTAGTSAKPRGSMTQAQVAAAAVTQARRNAIITAFAIAVIVATAFIYNGWMLDPRLYFYADDWQWLFRGEFVPWSFQYFSMLPSQSYNDHPVGAAFIKVLYQLVGLNHWVFHIALLALHAVNCVLLYTIATRYTGRAGALLAALLAAVWFSANASVGYTATIFDVLGATFCLGTVLLCQLSRRTGGDLRYDLAGAACYLLAIRTKEFALGTVLLLFLMNILLERQTVRAALKQLTPYLVVFAVYAALYARLLASAAPAISDPYHLDLSVVRIVANLGFYVRSLFYVETVTDLMVVAGLLVGLGAGMLVAEDRAQRTALLGIAGYVIMLAPVLLLTGQRNPLNLYAPHFFMALVLGALFAKRVIPTLAAVAAAVAILAAPATIHSREFQIGFYISKGEANQPMLESAVELLTPPPRGASIFISGVKPYFNPFSMQGGYSLKTALKEGSILVEVDKPEPELIAKFCKTTGAKRFLRFEGTQASDVTGAIARTCNRQ